MRHSSGTCPRSACGSADVVFPVTLPASLPPETARTLRRFRERRVRVAAITAAAAGAVALAVAGVTLAVLDHHADLADRPRWSLALLIHVGWIYLAIRTYRRTVGSSEVIGLASDMERSVPTLGDDVRTAVDLARDPVGSRSMRGMTQRRIATAMSRVRIGDAVPIDRLRRVAGPAMVAWGLIAASSLYPPLQSPRRLARVLVPGVSLRRASSTVLTLVRPDPPDRVVARGEDVVVEVRAEGYGERAPVLLRSTASGAAAGSDPDAIPLTRRDGPDAPFVANVPVDSDPVRYRVLAGDASTTWHTLTPRPRPRVVSIRKVVTPPAYARTPPRVVESTGSDGGLADGTVVGLAGSRVQLSVAFDQPVRDVRLRTADGSPAMVEGRAIDAKDEPSWSIDFDIDRVDGYSIAATGSDTGLDRPGAVRHDVVALTDRSPRVAWTASPDGSVVTADAVLSLGYAATDELPPDLVVQEIRFGNGPPVRRTLPTPVGDDLPPEGPRALPLHRITQTVGWSIGGNGDDGPVRRAVPGELIRTRILVRDRAGQWGGTGPAEILVAGGETPDDDAASLTTTVAAVRAVRDAMDDVAATVKAIDDALGNRDLTWDPAVAVEASDEVTEAIEPVRGLAKAAGDDAVDRSVHWRSVAMMMEVARHAMVTLSDRATGTAADRRSRASVQRDARALGDTARTLANLAEDLLAIAAAEATFDQTAGVIGAVDAVVGVETGGSIDRERIVDLLGQRLVAAAATPDPAAELIPGNQRQRFERFQEWTGKWRDRLANELNSKGVDQAMRSLRQLRAELEQQIAHNLYEPDVGNRLQNRWSHLIGRMTRLSNDLPAGLDADGDASAAWTERVARHTRTLATLARDGGGVDWEAADDLTALSTVLASFDQPRDSLTEERRRDIETLADLFSRLQPAAVLSRSATYFETVLRDEARSPRDGAAKLWRPTALDLGSVDIREAAKLLAAGGVPGEIIQPIDRVHYDQAFQRAAGPIRNRRWMARPAAGEQPVGEIDAVRELVETQEDSLEALRPRLNEDRQRLRAMVPDLPTRLTEAARRMDETARKARDRSDSGDGRTPEDVDRRRTEVSQLIREMSDRANRAERTGDIDAVDRNALDVETAVLSQDVRDLTDAGQSADDAAAVLERTADDLRAIAERVEDRTSDDGASEDRPVARRSGGVDDSFVDRASDVAGQAELERVRERLDELQSLSRRSFDEVERSLEEKLATDDAMRSALKQLTDDAAAAAEASMKRVVRRQREITRRFERSDPAAEERRRAEKDRTVDAAERVTMVARTLLPAATEVLRRGGRDGVGPLRSVALAKGLENQRRRLLEAAAALRAIDGDATAAEREAARGRFRDAVGETAGALNAAGEATSESKPTNAPEDDAHDRAIRSAIERINRDASREQQRRADQWRRRGGAAEKRAADHQRRADRNQNDAERWRAAAEAASANADAANEEADAADRARESWLDWSGRTSPPEQTSGEVDGGEPSDGSSIGDFATATLRRSAEELGAALDALPESAGPPSTTDRDAEAMREQQTGLREDVRTLANAMRRVARHRRRLDDEASAAEADRSAEALERSALPASDRVSEAFGLSRPSAEADRRSAEALDRSSQVLSEIAGQWSAAGSDEPSPRGSSGDPGDPAVRDAKLLDDADRQSREDAREKGSAGEAGEASGSSDEGTSSDADRERGVSDRRLRDARNRTAAARQRRLDAATGSSGDDNRESPSDGDAPRPGATSDGGRGTAAAGGEAGSAPRSADESPLAVAAVAEDWGDLRTRSAREVGESDRIAIPAAYAEEVREYFRSIRSDVPRTEPGP